MFIKKYVSPSNVSDIIMSSDSEYLTGLWIENTNDSIKHNDKQISCDLSIFDETKSGWICTLVALNQILFLKKEINYE